MRWQTDGAVGATGADSHPHLQPVPDTWAQPDPDRGTRDTGFPARVGG